jgi:hypothetical protein
MSLISAGSISLDSTFNIGRCNNFFCCAAPTMQNYFLILLLLVPGPSSGKFGVLVPGYTRSLDFLYVDQSVESHLSMHEP